MEFEYVGSELEIFRHATNWKEYYGGLISGYFGAEVIEVGAGLGATTEALCSGNESRWVCLEPDSQMSSVIEEKIKNGELPANCEAIALDLHSLGSDRKFDSVLYIDVLEHIEDDQGEVLAALEHLKENGHLIVLAPAHQSLYSPFDKAIGHFRRYNKDSLSKLIPDGLECVRLDYLDSVGALASIGNKIALRSAMPTIGQIRLWDSKLVPLSTYLDPLLRHRLGKSVLGIWRKNTGGTV